MVILRPDAEDDARVAVLDRVEEIITGGGGSVGKVDEWGKRRLAYEIDHMTEGYYYVLTFKTDAAALDEVTRVLKITDSVVRHMPVRLDEKAVFPTPAEARATVPTAEPAAEAESAAVEAAAPDGEE
jgi:small subunit ribosomal protein S6